MKLFKVSISIFCLLLLFACANNEANSQQLKENGRSENSLKAKEKSDVDEDIETIVIHGKYIEYDLENEMYEDADLVVLASPKNSFLDREHVATYSPAEGDAPEALASFFTRSSIHIKKVLKSPDGSDIQDDSELKIIEPLSIVEFNGVDKKLTIESYVEVAEDNDYIIYLKDNTYGEYGVINMNNGRFSIGPEDLFENLSDHDHGVDKQLHEELKAQVFERFANEIEDF